MKYSIQNANRGSYIQEHQSLVESYYWKKVYKEITPDTQGII
jgi:hypothetical protein